MGFFKDFKEDFNDAVNELVPGGDDTAASDEVMVNTLDGDIDVESELTKLDGLLEQVSKKVDEPSAKEAAPVEEQPAEKKSFFNETRKESKMEAPKTMGDMENGSEAKTVASDENAVITGGMKVTGNVESIGSIEVQGEIVGDVTCNGKLVVAGKVNGNSSSAEAKEEFPTLHVEERSAISIARRVMDPLSELIKIDPKSVDEI